VSMVAAIAAVIVSTGALLGFGYLLGYHDGKGNALDRQRWVRERARWTQVRLQDLQRWTQEAMVRTMHQEGRR